MNAHENKQIIQKLLAAVWESGSLDTLPQFWTENCINHAMPPGMENAGLDALRTYHEQFMSAFAAFSDVQTEIVQQVAENDRVVTHMVSRGRHTGGPFFGIPPTGKTVSLAAIRIDRIENGKIAEHWSVSDGAGLMGQLQTAP